MKNIARSLTAVEIIPVVLAVGISAIWPRILGIALALAAAFWIIRWVSSGKLGLRTPADVGILIILFMIPISWLVTAVPDETHLQVLRLLNGIALYYAIINWCKTKNQLRIILPGFSIAGLLLALVAPVSVQWAVNKLPVIPDSFFQQLPALFADLVHPNVLAGSLVIMLPIVLGLLLFSWQGLSWFERIINLTAAASIMLVLLLTLSRGAWIAFGAILVVMPMLRWRWGWIMGVLLAMGGFVIANTFGIDPILQFLASSGSIGGVNGRLEIWSRAVYMIRDFPFTGIGIGSFGQVSDVLYPFSLYEPDSIRHAHNLFLQIAVDLGLPGLIGWLLVFGSVCVSSWKLYLYGRKDEQKLAAGLGAGLLCSQLALAAHGLMDAVTWGMVRPAPLVWAIWGLAMAGWFVIVDPQRNEGQILSN